MEGIKQINDEREKKGKEPKYGKAKFETTFGNKVKAYSETWIFRHGWYYWLGSQVPLDGGGQIGPVEVTGSDGEDATAGMLLELLHKRETGILNIITNIVKQ